MSNLTQDNLPKFKYEYKNAVAEQKETFMFGDTEVLTTYAKYAIEYMEMPPLAKEVALHTIQAEEDNV